MPTIIDGQLYYRTAEVCQITNLSKGTLFRWTRGGILNDAQYRDRRGWRLFTKEEGESIKIEASRLIKYNGFNILTV